MKHPYLILSIFIITFFNSCEQLIDLKLTSIPPIPVVDAWIYSDSVFAYISETTPYDNNNNTPLLDVDYIKLEVGNNSIYLNKIETGKYGVKLSETPPSFTPINLEIKVKDNTFISASNSLPSKVAIDSTYTVYKPQGGIWGSGYYITILFEDIFEEENFYRIKIFNNGIELTANNILLESDINKNGVQIPYELPYAFSLNDSVEVELLSLSKSSYQYLVSLDQLSAIGSPSQSTPENPPFNVKGDAIGFFGAATKDQNKLRIHVENDSSVFSN
ncbi:DUF4249 domain-containing protein [Sediminitomix flava]|uniref:Uncharacterized protein DUF4249 n=1 Tax=Sediminitomix flava TaxID=379075 RepID=A0A316A1U7_SEDFL|nr:DUF4249 domain-containing protein [Sediminitomix flava]PWJ43667.1 uncharacterized protein DUF4249 [Sediminitomix flava]